MKKNYCVSTNQFKKDFLKTEESDKIEFRNKLNKIKDKAKKKIVCILTKPLRGKGGIGDIIPLARGFARYLEKYNMANRATPELIQNIEAKKIEWQQIELENSKIGLILLDKVKAIDKITITKRVAQGSKLYESVKKSEILLSFEQLGINLKPENIKIDNTIKTLGVHEIIINVYGNLETKFIVEIIKE